jgi:hypothetical protein
MERLYFSLILSALITSCTSVTYDDNSGKSVRVVDFHPVGGAVDLFIFRPDGTILEATRSQPSSEALVSAVIEGAIDGVSPLE